MAATSAAVLRHAAEAMFGRRLVTNSFRSFLVEAMLDLVLRPDWIWVAADYASWDFEHPKGTRLEVKQSAARQSWPAGSSGYTPPRFDIAPRKFRLEGSDRIAQEGRCADLYVFAYHPRTDDEADHREPSQWRFYVVREDKLPDQKTINLSGLTQLTRAIELDQIAESIEAELRQQSSPRT